MIAGLAMLLASTAGGTNLTDVRVGVHKDYSRVVFQLDGVSPYQLSGLESEPEGGQLLTIVLEAAPIGVAPIRPAKSRHIRELQVGPGATGGSQVRIRLSGDVEMKELVLRKPDRIVIDFYDPGAGVASLVSSLVTKTPAATPSAPVPLESGELAAVSQPIAPQPAQGLDEPSENLAAAPADGFQEAGAEQPEQEKLEGEVIGGAAEEVEQADAPEDAFAGVEIGEVVAEEPAQQMPPGTSPESADPQEAESNGSLLGSPVVMAALAGVALIALVFVLGRRRRAESEAEALSPLDAADDVEPEDDDGFAFAEGTQGEDDTEGAEEVAVPAVDESEPPPAADHDIEPAAIAADETADQAAKEGTQMDQGTDYPAPAGAGGALSPAPLSAMGSSQVGTGDTAKLVEEFDRRIAHLENRLEEVVDAKERLERQVSAQTEELRVQRAAIARTQRVLRTIARPEEEATEPAPKL
ncbi:MAG: hypothetical protein GY946_22415 [bacterium]|nr:hypothetical protein [bacterium]